MHSNGRSNLDILQSLKYLQKYKDYVLCLQKANRSEILLHGLDMYMLTVTDAKEKSFFEKCELYYYSGALYNIFLHWIRDGMNEDIEVVAQIIYDHVKHNRYDMTGVPLEIFPKEPQQ